MHRIALILFLSLFAGCSTAPPPLPPSPSKGDAILLRFPSAQEREQARQKAREDYVQAHPELDGPTKEAILKGHIIIGMSSNGARAAWGNPERINRSGNASGVSEQWVYGDNFYVYFEDGVLTSWQDSK